MRESTPSLGTPPRLLAEECVLRAILDVLEEIHPSATHLVFDRAHQRLTQIGPKMPHEVGFFISAHDAIDAIMQVPSMEDISANRAGTPRETVPAEVALAAEGRKAA